MIDRTLTAMCLWEAWLAEIRNSSRAGDNPVAIEMERLQVVHGTATMREVVAGLAEVCDTAWDAASQLEDCDSFDWDFCPAWLHGLVESGQLMETSYAVWRGTPRQMVEGDIR